MSTWFSQRVVDIVGWISDAYYTRKYGTMARRLGRSDVGSDGRRGFIIVEIDGLSHDDFRRAVARGAMPYVGQLLDDDHLVASRWRCGIPSTTPAVQAGLLFGNRFDIPGFRWYEKERQQSVVVRRPDQIREVRARISQGRIGILRGGSCYVSIFDGDADLALFTVSTLNSQRFFESVRGLGLFLLFLLSPFRVLRLIGLTIVNYVAGLGRRVAALAGPSVMNPFDLLSPLLHAVSDVLFTEVQTFGVLLDIYRRVPSIFANYSSYDEVAHKLGPDHPAAFRTLRGIDKRVRQIDRMRARYRQKEYDLFLMSDHGNSRSVPFAWRAGKSLGQYIAAQIGSDHRVIEQLETVPHSAEKQRYLFEELLALEERGSPRLRRVLRAVRRYVDRRELVQQQLGLDLGRQRDIVASVSGPLAHVYFKVSSLPLDLIEVILVYPELLDDLLGAPGIGVAVGRAGDRTVVLGHEGGMLVVDAGHETVEGTNPLALFGDVHYVARQLHLLAHFPHSGDLILLGEVSPDGGVVAFEDQLATHGGWGGTQGHPFVAWPSRCSPPSQNLDGPEDLYTYFADHYL